MLKTLVALAALLSLAGAAPVDGQADPAKKDYSHLFIELPNFGKMVQPATVAGPPDKPEAYAQKAMYDWLGGRFEQYEITYARDPNFKKLYAADAVRKTKPEPKEIKLGKKTAWYWDFMPMGVDNIEQTAHVLVIVLADDKAVIIRRKGAGLDMVRDVAGKLDLGKIEEALNQPPKTK